MSYELHECRSERAETAHWVAFSGSSRSQRPLFLSLVSVAWPFVCSIGLVGLRASPAAWAAGPSRPASVVGTRPRQPARASAGILPRLSAVAVRHADRRGCRPGFVQPAPCVARRRSRRRRLDDCAAPSPANEATSLGCRTEDRLGGRSASDSELVALQAKIRRVLAIYFPKHQNTRDNNAWEVMHEIIAFGVDSQLYRGGPQGPKVNAIGWLCYNGSCKGEQMLYLDRGNLVARKGPGLQGHFGQFLAILAQSRLPIDYPMLVHGKSFTIGDLVEHEKTDCQPGEELTFKLIGLMHYLDSDETWTSRYGESGRSPA